MFIFKQIYYKKNSIDLFVTGDLYEDFLQKKNRS